MCRLTAPPGGARASATSSAALLLLVGRELGQAAEQECVLPGAHALERALARRRDAHPGAATVVGIGHPGHHAGLGQAGDDPRHGRRLHLLDGGQLAQRGAAVPAAPSRAPRPGRREPAEGLLAEPPLQPVHGAAEPAGNLFVGQLDGLRCGMLPL